MKALETLYSPAMVARSGSYSPSAEKPAAVVEDLLTSGISLSIQAPAPVTREDLCRAHDPAYVDGVLGLRRANGFGNRSAEVARSLLFTSGAMLAGARRAIERRVAFAPCSGFHHAGWMLGGGFCTFNGLMVTALALLDEGAAKRVAILDCDMHYGNGTDDILGRLGRPPSILHFTAGAKFHEASQASAFFEWLARAVEACAGCDVVLYQAGADPHVDRDWRANLRRWFGTSREGIDADRTAASRTCSRSIAGRPSSARGSSGSRSLTRTTRRWASMCRNDEAGPADLGQTAADRSLHRLRP